MSFFCPLGGLYLLVKAFRPGPRKSVQLGVKSAVHFVIASVFLELQDDRGAECDDSHGKFCDRDCSSVGTGVEEFLPEPLHNISTCLSLIPTTINTDDDLSVQIYGRGV